MIAFEEALALVLEAAAPLPACEVPLPEAVSRVLAEDVRADLPVPGFDTTAMDGWAVRAAEAVRAPTLLAVAGASGAGSVPGKLPPGSAWKVMTGAPMPPGSDAVVPVEDAADVEGGSVRLDAVPKSGAHIRRRGEVYEAGALLLAAGRRLTPADLVLAAAAGREKLRVARAPRAGVLVTGDELVPPGTQPGPGELRNTNGPLLLAALRRAGADVVSLGVAPDDEAALARALRDALIAKFDVLLTTGGVSAGDYDFVGKALAAEGARVRFHKVSIRPAKPVLFATKGPTLVFGLPGNPVSAAVAFDFFVRPALRAAAGLLPPLPPAVPARLTARVKNKGPRLAFHPALLAWDAGRLCAEPLATRGSHDILAHAQADAFLELAPESSWEAGDSVPVHRGTAESTF
ncbi:MAG TPA: molybdopterin molybdotransferase MoeA [Thermoanaerobaculia bacterium]|nr:molybdopterin molybdotransferase MoeA [Thermoanaerobaculia bacterium]